MADVIDHISEIDQEIELLKRNQRPKIQVTKKDITSPLMSVMHEMEIDRGKISFPGSRSKEREGRNYDSGEPINVTRKVVEEEKVGYDNDYSRTSDLQGSRVEASNTDNDVSDYYNRRDISPVEEIMRKDYESKRKFDKLKKSDSNKGESFKKKQEDEKKVERFSGRKIISPTESDKRSDITFRKDQENKNEDDLKVEDMIIESSKRDKKPSGRFEKLQKLTNQNYDFDQVEQIKPGEISRSKVTSPDLKSSHFESKVTLIGPQGDTDNEEEEEEEEYEESDRFMTQSDEMDVPHGSSETDFDYVESISTPSNKNDQNNKLKRIDPKTIKMSKERDEYISHKERRVTGHFGN